MADVLLEVCVEDPNGLAAAVAGGADRIELCSGLALGGLTPSDGLMAAAATCPIPVYAMIRPRAGDFAYRDAEIDVMIDDIGAARRHGLQGVVFGAIDGGGRLHETQLRRLFRAAAGMGATLHRAFDLLTCEVEEGVEQAVALGFERILTSGRAPSAAQGLPALLRALARASGRISIMPGGGLTPDMIARFLALAPASEIHASCSAEAEEGDLRVRSFGFGRGMRRFTDERLVRRLKDAMRAPGPAGAAHRMGIRDGGL